MMWAMPKPSQTVTPMTCNVELDVVKVIMSNRSAATTSIPKVTTSLLPKRATQRVDIGANTIIINDCGMSTAPALMVL
jgi:hypothetical protein